MPAPPRTSRSSRSTSGATSARDSLRTGTTRSTPCRFFVSSASRENTVISTCGRSRRSCVTIDCRIASSPRFSPPYEPVMPTLRASFSAIAADDKQKAIPSPGGDGLADTAGDAVLLRHDRLDYAGRRRLARLGLRARLRLGHRRRPGIDSPADGSADAAVDEVLLAHHRLHLARTGRAKLLARRRRRSNTSLRLHD